MRTDISVQPRARVLAMLVTLCVALAATFTITSATKAHAGVVGACNTTVPDAKAIVSYSSQLQQQGKTQAQIDSALAKKFGIQRLTPKTLVVPHAYAVQSDLQITINVYTAGGNGCGTPYGYAETDWHFTNGLNGRVTTECSIGGSNYCRDAEDDVSILDVANDGSSTGIHQTSAWAQSWGYHNPWASNPNGNGQPWNYGWSVENGYGITWPMYTYDGYYWPNPTGGNPNSDFSAANGAAGESFVLPQGVPCKYYSFEGYYTHSWNSTNLSNVQIGFPWNIQFTWSKSGYNWAKSSTQAQYYLCF